MIEALLSFIPGGWLTGAGAAVAAALLAAWRIYVAGQESERAKQHRRRLDAIRDRKELDDEIDALGHADLDRRFDRWRLPDDRAR